MVKADFSKLEEILAKRGKGPEALIAILQDAQKAYGYLSEETVKRISEETNIPEARIYGVITFYNWFRLAPIGKNLVRVCHGTACHVGGAESVSQEVSKILGVDDGETTPDGKFTLEQVACLGCCSLAPCMMINEDVYGRLDSPKKIQEVLEGY